MFLLVATERARLLFVHVQLQKHLERQRRRVMQEIGTFRIVEDHPNAVRVLEVFEGAECYYVVMECCEGGELFDHISKKASVKCVMDVCDGPSRAGDAGSPWLDAYADQPTLLMPG